MYMYINFITQFTVTIATHLLYRQTSRASADSLLLMVYPSQIQHGQPNK